MSNYLYNLIEQKMIPREKINLKERIKIFYLHFNISSTGIESESESQRWIFKFNFFEN